MEVCCCHRALFELVKLGSSGHLPDKLNNQFELSFLLQPNFVRSNLGFFTRIYVEGQSAMGSSKDDETSISHEMAASLALKAAKKELRIFMKEKLSTVCADSITTQSRLEDWLE